MIPLPWGENGNVGTYVCRWLQRLTKQYKTIQIQFSVPGGTWINSHHVTRNENNCLIFNWEVVSPKWTHFFYLQILTIQFAFLRTTRVQGYLSASLLGGTATCASWRRNQFLGHTQVLLFTHYEELVTWAQCNQNVMRRWWSWEAEAHTGKCQLLSSVSKNHFGSLGGNS